MRRFPLAILLAIVSALPLGCGGVRASRMPAVHSLGDFMRRPGETRSHDDLESLVLCREGLAEADGTTGELAVWFDAHPSPQLALVLAERSYRQARAIECRSWGRAITLHRDAAAYASIALEGSGAIGERAREAHDAAVVRLLELAQKCPILSKAELGTDWQATLHRLGIATIGTSRLLAPDRIARLVPADEYHVSGLSHQYASAGLGVPFVALWPPEHERNARAPNDRFFPEHVATPATAVLQAGAQGAGGTWHGRSLTLILHDPFESRAVEAGGKVWPLASDRTTALAVQVNRGRGLRRAALTGVLASDLGRFEEGLYLLRPYQPGKIPVVLVHGLISSPLAWAETYNELCNDHVLAERYQFWMFLYATGEPIPVAASHLRNSLREALATFDPSGSESTLRQMVVIGHSQGGLLTKILAQDSGLTIWDALVNIPYPASRLASESQALLNRALIFRPEPYVRRLVFIATPHGGSPLADGPLGKLGLVLSRPQGNTARLGDELEAAYGPGSYNGGLRGETFSLRNLSQSSRVIQGLRETPIDPSVPHHSIVLQMKHPTIHGRGDGVVPYESSHLPSASSEILVRGFHVQVGQPGVTDELRRILQIHLQEARADIPAGVSAGAAWGAASKAPGADWNRSGMLRQVE
ncbi:MAG TPA: lysophospholipase [Isosphaeraceae bacterium]|nr:lysophospholipase [Isosphaeraceae bacterium]